MKIGDRVELTGPNGVLNGTITHIGKDPIFSDWAIVDWDNYGPYYQKLEEFTVITEGSKDEATK